MTRCLLVLACVCLAGCSPGLTFNDSNAMSLEEMRDRASQGFVGVIEQHELEWWPFFRVPGDDNQRWRIARRRVRVETVLFGPDPGKTVDVYEIFWTGGATGNWNSTHDGDRCIFLTRIENGRHHVVRDWWRSIFEVRTGRKSGLPGSDVVPFWERVALMNWRLEEVPPNLGPADFHERFGALSSWRKVKLLRGWLRHPAAQVRMLACEELVYMRSGIDECWDTLATDQRTHLNVNYNAIPPEQARKENLAIVARGLRLWDSSVAHSERTPEGMDELRILTTINDPALRARFCRAFQKRFPGDHDNGCPASQRPPATIVTRDGDVPLPGAWPPSE